MVSVLISQHFRPHRALCLLALVSSFGLCSGFFGWLYRRAALDAASASDPGSASPPGSWDPSSLPGVPFEMTVVDEKFLAEAKGLDLSPLDSCHYKVIAKLQSSCSSLSEEELAKLGVALFNCQAEVEGRRTYACTAEMTIGECTADMDANTWNAYHIVSNRARSVCYATRQQYFKRRTELTVNALVATATNQLAAMKLIKAGQEELKDLTAASLEKVVSSQGELLDQQGKLRTGQEQLESSIGGNLEKLTQEKALIASGQQQVAQLIQGITEKMDNVSKQLVDQDTVLQDRHGAILTDLSEVQSRAQEVYHNIESDLALFISYQNQTAQYYKQLMEKLQRMNRTLEVVLQAMDRLQSSVESKLDYIQKLISWAGGNLNAVYTCVFHTAYFLVAALLMAFLQTPAFSRTVLLVLVIMNALSELNRCISMNFECLSIFIILTALDCSPISGNTTIMGASPPAPKVPLSLANLPGPTFTPFLKQRLSLANCTRRDATEQNVMDGISQHRLGSVFEAILGSKVNSPNQSTASSVCSTKCLQQFDGFILFFFFPRRSVSSMSPRQPCRGVTRTGQPCRNKTGAGQNFCRLHASGQVSYF
ncbi:protein brambleberry-like [Latimeria chalumnae]|uniref:protein brambleberry-like n=1 Tax=Latimeria chalumnae TaxID=7897 RepID=UPI00313AF6F1